MDQTDFAIAMVNGVLIIIIAILLLFLFKIIGKKKNAKQNDTVLPDINKIELRELQKKGSEIEIMEEQKKEPLKGSTEPIKEITLSQPVILSSEENEKTKKKARTKRSSSKNLEKAEKLKEIEISEKKPRKKPGKKVSTKKKTQAIVNQNPVSG